MLSTAVHEALTKCLMVLMFAWMMLGETEENKGIGRGQPGKDTMEEWRQLLEEP